MENNKITVFGAGYVGLVTAICLAELGNDVCSVDIDQKKIAKLQSGIPHIYERDLDKLLQKNLATKRINFTTDLIQGVKHGDYLFIAVGTPSNADGSANLQYVYEVAETIGQNLEKYCIIINKSTVPVGTGDKVNEIVESALTRRSRKIDFDIVSNPEFLKQGDAIQDFMHSDRIIIGYNNARAREKMRDLYKSLNTNIVSMDILSAELTKYAANTFLAARISFMNAIAGLAEKVGADVESIRQGISTDPRVGPYFLYAGCGYGGSCFPKDVKALIKTSEKYESNAELFKSIENINEQQKRLLVTKMMEYFKGNLQNKTIALWGLAFKPNTDDMREAPSLIILEELWQNGAKVKAYDPIAMDEARKIFGKRDDFLLCPTATTTLENADALVIVTEWNEFLKPDFNLIKQKLKNAVIFDGRNIYSPAEMAKLGIKYYCIGRT
jgi:UDPglucose 6-dehydrogenase